MNKKEILARLLYDKYCAAVGGLAFNGDKLPDAIEFFADATKVKQVDAWLVVAETALEFNDPTSSDWLLKYLSI